MTDVAQQVVNALSVGSTYALLALGLAMVFTILGLINFAHGELVTVAAYTMYLLQSRGLPFGIQIVGAILAAGVAAIAMERIAFRPLRGASFATLLLASFALSVTIQGLVTIIAGPITLGVPTPDFLARGFNLGSVYISNLQVLTIATCAVLLAVLTLFMRRTTIGLGMRAAAQDFPVTRLMGIRANAVIALAFAISGMLAGVAAIFIVSSRGGIDAQMGFFPVLAAFISIVIGGLGSLSGAVIGGFVLGGIEVLLGAVLPPGLLPFRDAFTLIAVIVILYFRPQGILGRRIEVS